MSALAAGLLGGILIALAAPGAWQLAAFGVLVAMASMALLARWRAPAIALVAGFLLAHSAAQQVLMAPRDCGERRLVSARIDSIPVPQGAGWQYDAWLEPASPPKYPALRVRLSHPGAVPPASGERWQLLVQFDSPGGGTAAADRRRALLRDHASATARVRESPLNRRLSAAAPSIDGLRAAVAGRIQARVQDPTAAALLAALAVGVTGEVSALQWRVFSATGITHLVAISGMHVTFFALLCMAVARVLWRHWDWLGARCRRESFAAGVGIVLAFCYALLSGFSVPAQRTALMLTVFLAARGCGRHVAPTWSVAASLVLVLLLDPLAVLGAGFWLSFCAVAAIILLAGGRVQPPGSLRAAALVQWVVTVALLPVTAALFGSFSAVGPLVNAVAIPLFTFALVPPVLVATALYLLPLDAAGWCADHLVDIAAWTAREGWPWLVRAADLPGALLGAGSPGLWLLLSVPAVVCALAPLPAAMRLGAIALLASGFPAAVPRLGPGGVEVVVFDVGAARSVLLRTRGHQLLIGTGEGFGTAGRRFERVVLPSLGQPGARADLVLDRADRDSLQALAVASTRRRLGRAIIGDGGPVPGLDACADEEWEWDGVWFLRRATADGCWHAVRAGGRLLVVAPARTPAGTLPGFGHASLVVLPRSARDAQGVMGQALPGALALAGLSSGEWQSAGWRRLREEGSRRGQSLWSTAVRGELRLTLRADGRLASSGSILPEPGIWSAIDVAQACAIPAR